jgi:hypothetical protein
VLCTFSRTDVCEFAYFQRFGTCGSPYGRLPRYRKVLLNPASASYQVIDAVYRAVGHNPGAAGNSRKNGPGAASRSTEVDDDEPYGGGGRGGAVGSAGPGELICIAGLVTGASDGGGVFLFLVFTDLSTRGCCWLMLFRCFAV